MPSTNRGSIRKTLDRYCTPDYTIKSLLDNVDNGIIGNNILECASGNNDISDLLMGNVITLDIDKDVNPTICINFLEFNHKNIFDTIITNPPYNLAIEFIKHSLNIVKDNGYVVMLLRLNFLESQTRKQFFIDNPLHSLYVLSRRPSFINGKTDSTGYAWFIWKKGKEDQSVIMKFV